MNELMSLAAQYVLGGCIVAVITFPLTRCDLDLCLPLWSADFETGDKSQWYRLPAGARSGAPGGEFNSGMAWSEVTGERARTGTYSLKMTIHTPPESGVRFFRWYEPQQTSRLIYRVWYNFPRHYAVSRYWNVLQWKSKRDHTQVDPFIVLNVGNRLDGAMFFYLYDWQQRRSFVQSRRNIPEGKWTKVEAFYECSPERTGRVVLWQDGEVLFDIRNLQTRYAKGDCQWSVDNYSSNVTPSPATVYIDDVSIDFFIGDPAATAPPGVTA